MMKKSVMTAMTRSSFVTALVLAAAAVLLTGTTSASAPRELKLVIKDMAFHLEGADGTRNPDLRFKAGEEIKLTIVNQDVGMRHNFTIEEWKVGTRLIRGGNETTLDFKVPDTPGETQYICTPHRKKMFGKVIVE
jgi:plastocyanin